MIAVWFAYECVGFENRLCMICVWCVVYDVVWVVYEIWMIFCMSVYD